MRVGALIVRMLRIEHLWLRYQKIEMLRIRILRVRAYSEKAIPRIPLGAGACARRGGGSTWNAHEKHEARRASRGGGSPSEGALKTHMKSTRKPLLENY